MRARADADRLRALGRGYGEGVGQRQRPDGKLGEPGGDEPVDRGSRAVAGAPTHAAAAEGREHAR